MSRHKRRYLGSWTLPSGNSCNVYLGLGAALACEWDTPPSPGVARRGHRALPACDLSGDPPRRSGRYRPARAWGGAVSRTPQPAGALASGCSGVLEGKR